MTRGKSRVVMAESSDIYHDYRVQKEAASLAAAGYRVTVRGFRGSWRCPAGRPLPFLLRTLPVFSRRRRKLRNLSMVVNIALINLRLLATRADFYHAHNTMFLAGMWLASRLHGGRFIYDAHEVQWEHGRGAAWLEARFIRRADAVINVSPGRAEVLAARFDLPPGRITVISNYPVLDPDAPAGPPAPRREGPLRLIFSGGYDLRSNRLDVLLRALARVDGVELHLLAFGYGDGEQVLKRLVGELGLTGRVHFLPLVRPDEVMSVVARHDVAVNMLTNPQDHLSIRHPSTNKMYEYLAAGLPVLCSDLPGFIEEFVENGAAVAVRAEDPDDVARGLRVLLADPGALERMRASASRLARERFNWATQERKLLDLYAGLGGGPPGGRRPGGGDRDQDPRISS